MLDRDRAAVKRAPLFVTREVLIYPGIQGCPCVQQHSNGFFLTEDLLGWFGEVIIEKLFPYKI